MIDTDIRCRGVDDVKSLLTRIAIRIKITKEQTGGPDYMIIIISVQTLWKAALEDTDNIKQSVIIFCIH